MKGKQVTIYPPQGQPLEFEFLGLAMDAHAGVLAVRVRNAEGRELQFVGLPFSMEAERSSIEVPARSPLIRG